MTSLTSSRSVLLFAAAYAVATGVHVSHIVFGMGSHGQDLIVDLMTTAALVIVGLVAWRLWREVRESRDKLERTEARHRSIVETAGEAIIVIDDQATIITFNSAAERIFGYKAVEIVGSSLERLMTDGARQAHAAYLACNGVTAMVEAVRLRLVHKGLRKSGEIFPFELTMAEWRDGERRMFTGIMRDVTERERTALALRESQARYDGMFENSGDLLFIYVLEAGEFVLECMNRAAEQRTGRAREAVAGAPAGWLVGPEHARGLKRALLRCLDTRENVQHELQITVEGEVIRALLTLSPMRNGAGEVTRVLARGELRELAGVAA